MSCFLIQKHIRILHTLVSVFVLAVVLVAAIPVPVRAVSPTINYQGKLTTSANVAVPNGQYNIRFWLLTSPSIATTSAVWTESLTGSNRVQVTNGLFSVMLGSTTPLTSVDFSQTLYLGVEIGGTSTPAWDGEMSPRKLLGTVPAAFEAENAQTLDGIATSSFLRSDQDDTASGLLTFTGGFISSASSTITNLTTGIATTTTLVINNQAFTNLLGTGLTNQSGVLTVSTTTLGFGALAALNSIDISSHTNLGVTATGLTLSGDNIALSGGYTIPLTASTTEWSNKGDVSGPASAIDNAIARFDLTTGKLIQNSLATVTDGGAVAASSFIPSSSTVPTNGMYLPSTNTLGWAINSAAELRLSATELAPAVNDGLALGSTTLGFSDVFLASQAVMNWNNGNVTLTHEADKLSFEGASSGYIFSDGNVGIGSSTPSHILTVAGDTNITGALRFNGSAGTTGQVLVSNGASAPAWTSTSSLGFSSSFSNSAQLAALLSDETGTAGSVVFSGGPTFTGNTTLANASTTNFTNSGNAYLGTIQSGTWNGTDIDISDYTNLGVTATGLTLSGDNIALSGGYTIPLTASTTEWATAYGWGNHGSAGYLTTAAIDTSSEIATIVTNEVGSGPLVFASSTVLTSPTIFGKTSMVNASTTALTVSTSAWLPSTLTLGSNTFTRSGAHNLTLTTTGNTTVTLPTSGTLAALTSAMTGTFDGNNFAGGAVATGDILYGGSAGSIAELTIAASSSVLLSNGTTPVWGRVASSSLLTSTWTPGLVMMASSTAPGGLAWTATSSLGIPSGTVTSVAMTVPTGLSVSGSPITTSGTLAVSLQGGYTIPLTASTTEWASAAASTTALTPAYIQSLFTGDEGITRTNGSLSFDCSEVEGTGINCTGEDITLDATGDWTGTFDGQQGTAYLDRANHTGTQATSTITGVFADASVSDTLTIGTGSTIADDLIIEPDLSADVAAADGDFLQYDSTGTNFTWRDAGEVRSDLGLVIGTNVQAWDAQLDDVADGTFTTDFVNTANPWADNEVADILTVTGGTLGSNTISSGATWTTSGTLTIGDGGDRIDIASNSWDVTNGTITGATWNGTDIDISDYTNLGVTATGLTLSGDNIALSGGYTIPLTASTTEWATAYGWGNHALAGYATSSFWGGSLAGNIYSLNASNTGIGTTTPSARLTVVGESTSVTLADAPSALTVFGGTGGIGDGFTAGAGGNIILTGGTGGSNAGMGSLGGTGGSIVLNPGTGGNADNTGAYGNVVMASTGGKVGIGTTTPFGKLHIYSGASTAGSASSLADELVIEGSSYAGLSILTPDSTGVANLYFGHNNDNDAGRIVYNNSNDSFDFFNSGSQTLKITNTGNVGIGTTTPSYPLSVMGTAYVGSLIAASTTLTSSINHRLDVGVTNGSHGNPGILNVRSIGSDTSIGFENDSLGEASIIFNNSTYGLTMEGHTPGVPITIRPNGAMAGYFSDDGNVGIGTSTLQSTRLTVNGGMSLSGALLDSTRATGTVGMVLQSTGTSTRWTATSSLGFSSSFSNSAQLAALLSDETGTAGSVVFSSGPTFTGNTTLANASTTNLTISGNTYLRTILPETNLTYNIGSSAQRFNEGWISTLNLGTSTWSMTQSANGRFSLFDAASGGGTERFTVLTNGNVGVGTTSPLARLDVYGAAGSNPAFRVSSSTNATMFTVNANGNVGVGSTNPGARLEVVGDIISKGTEWTSRTSAADNHWQSVTYGNGLFVAVSSSGSSNRVMTSPDGTNWTTRTSAADRGWNSVTYGNGLFVAVANSGSTNRVMTSPDGITWTTRASTLNAWNSVTYGNGLFVAVSYDGSGNRVMTSPDGITWTTRTSAADNQWLSVTYGNGLFVAVSYDGSGNRVMTSPDGITWTIGTSATNNTWQSVTYGNGLFVAVADSGSSNRVMTSPDGITWTSRTSATSNGWRSVTYGNGLFVAVSESGSGDRVMTSPDGITWTTRTSAPDNSWRSVTYGNGLFVAVGLTGSSNRVMTSGKTEISALAHNNLFQGGMSILGGNTGIGTTSPSQLLTVSGTSSMRTILPETNLTYNIGSSAQRFNEGWISTLNLGTSTWSMTQSANGRFSLFDAASGGGTERFTVLTNGNVGIGTTTPANALHIQTAGAGEALTLQKTGTGWIGQNFIVGSKTWTLYNSSNISNQGFGVYDTTNSVYRFAIDGTDGNVGISTTSPLARLDVYGAAGSNPAFRVSSSTNTTMFTVNANGNVGIGTTSPQRALHVQISSDAPPVRFQDSNGYCEINPTTTTWSCTSDRRLKENIKSLDPASILANLSELRPVSFAWKTDANHEDRIGLIAQEVEEFFPDLVLTDSASGMKSVAYGGFTPYLIAGVQELVQTNRNLATLLMTGTSTFATSSPFAALLETEDSLWSRLMTLAENFMDGVLTLAGIRTDELCVGSVCIDEATFLQMVEQSGGASSAPSDPEDDEDEPPYIEDTENGTSTPEIEDETGSSTEDGTEETGESGEGTNPEGGEGGSAPEEIVPEPEPEEQVTEEDPPLVPEEDTEPVGGGSAETSGETGGTGV